MWKWLLPTKRDITELAITGWGPDRMAGSGTGIEYPELRPPGHRRRLIRQTVLVTAASVLAAALVFGFLLVMEVWAGDGADGVATEGWSVWGVVALCALVGVFFAALGVVIWTHRDAMNGRGPGT